MEVIDLSYDAKKYRAYKINSILFLTRIDKRYAIIRRIKGRTNVLVDFETFDEAKEFVQWFEETYNEFLDIWMSDPNADISVLCQHSISNGEQNRVRFENARKQSLLV